MYFTIFLETFDFFRSLFSPRLSHRPDSRRTIAYAPMHQGTIAILTCDRVSSVSIPERTNRGREPSSSSRHKSKMGLQS